MGLFSKATDLAKRLWEMGPGPKGRRDALVKGYAGFGGFSGRLLGDMPGIYSDPNSLVRSGLAEIRAKARHQALMNPYAKQAVRSLQTNIMGARGVQLRGTIPLGGKSNLKARGVKAAALRDVTLLLRDGNKGAELDLALDRMILAQATLERDEELNTILESKWRRFCGRASFDVAGRLSFHQYELGIVGALPTHGGALVRIIRRAAPGLPKTAPQICFQLLSCSQLDELHNGASDRPGHYWRMGIETNEETGRVTRYALLRVHPNSVDHGIPAAPKHVFLDAADLIHIFIPEEIGQLREIPWLASVLPTLHNINEYERSHWTRKRVINNTLGFIQKPDDGVGTSLVDEDEPDTGELISNSSPGQWIQLLPGEQPIPPQFGADDQMYDVVLKTMLRRFSSGVGLSYSTNTRDYSDANYSSMRESLLEDRDYFRTVQSLLIQQFHQRVYEEWMKAAMLSGDLPSAQFVNYWNEPELFTAPRWQARTWSWVDPAKEMKAYREAQRLGLQSTADQMAELYGTDLETTWAQIAYELMLRKKLGLPMVTDGIFESVSYQSEDGSTTADGSSDQL